MSDAPTDPGLRLWIVDRAPAELRARIRLRAGQMLDQGLIEEVRRIRARIPKRAPWEPWVTKRSAPTSTDAPPKAEKSRRHRGPAPGNRACHPPARKKAATWFSNLTARLGEASRRLELPGESWRNEFNRLYSG